MKVIQDRSDDHPAHLDQLRSEGIDVLKEADAWVLIAHSEKDAGTHLMFASPSGISNSQFALFALGELAKLCEQLIEEAEELEEEGT